MKLEFSQQIFEKYSNLTFHENPPSDSRDVPWEQMEGHTGKLYVHCETAFESI